MMPNRTLNNKISKLHERALRIALDDDISSYSDLLVKSESYTIHERNLQKLATLMYKVKNNLSPKIVSNIFSKFSAPYVFRNEKVWETGNVRTTLYGTETISYRGPGIWKYVPTDIKNFKTLTEFKNKIKIPEDCTRRLQEIYTFFRLLVSHFVFLFLYILCLPACLFYFLIFFIYSFIYLY